MSGKDQVNVYILQEALGDVYVPSTGVSLPLRGLQQIEPCQGFSMSPPEKHTERLARPKQGARPVIVQV